MFIKIADVLIDKGYKVYSIGQYEGLCTSPYVVIKETTLGGTLHKSLGRQIVEIYPFLPFGRYTNVIPFIDKLKEDLKGISGLKEDSDIPSFIIVDDKAKAYTTKITYQIIKRRR